MCVSVLASVVAFSAYIVEGLNGANRQMAQKLTVNRQKRNITVNRQMSEPKLAVKFLRYP